MAKTTEFTLDQQQEIEKGTKEGLDVSVYANPEFLAIQMRQIRLGLEEGLPVACYASVQYDWFQMEEIRKGLIAKIDVNKYADPSIPFDTMRQIRKGLEGGLDFSMLKKFPAGVLKQLRIASGKKIDIRRYITEGYTEEQLYQIRLAKEKSLDIDPYITLQQRGASIREIAIGLEKGLDVTIYAKAEMNWRQMREIRLGLQEQLDVSVYQKILYSWEQMREIRLGMEQNLSVEKYQSLMYTAKEMKKKRLMLLSGETEAQEKGHEEKEQYKDFMLLIGADQMEAYIMVTKDGAKLHREWILAALNGKGIISGINYKLIDELAAGEAKKGMLTVASGTEPTRGADGWYEYFFETDLKKQPKKLENGSVDYQNVKWCEVVKKDQKVAFYHRAEEGIPGTRINGEKIPGLKGKELLPLQGTGITLLPDRQTYVAAMNGKIELKDRTIEITDMLVLDEVTGATGNVEFNGSVYVRGMVGDGATIKAAGDILVDGFTEAAVLEAGGNIILRKGNNPGGRGRIQAKGDVSGSFFENARVIAGGDVKANYCLKSEIMAEQDVIITGKIGSLVGGSIQAGNSITSYDIGNLAGLQTKLYVGKAESYYIRRTQLAQKKKTVDRELELLRDAYLQFQNKYPPEIRNTNEMYLKIEDAIYTKEKEQKELKAEGLKMQEEEEKAKTAKIVIKGTVYPGVQVNINGAKWHANQVTNVTLRKTEERLAVYKNS